MSGEVAGSIRISTELDTTQLERSLSSLKKTALRGVTVAIAAVGAAVVKLGKDSVMAASDLSEVQNVVDTAFGDGADQINEFARNAKTAYGISELAAKKYTGTLGAMTKSMGLTGEESVELSTNLTGLAGDFASFYNLDHEDAFNKIRAGISGETEPLKQLGINMSVANLEAYALAQGIEKSYNSMTQAEQVLLRYNYLMTATADAQGDFAKTAETSLANSLRILSLEFEELSVQIGQDLLPIAMNAVQSLTELVHNIATVYSEEGFEGIAKGIGELISSLAKTASENLPLIVDIGANIIESLVVGLVENTPAILASLAELFVKLVAVSVENVAYWMASLVAMLLIGGQNMIEAIWEGIENAYDWLMNLIAGLIVNIAEAFGKCVELLIEAGEDFVSGLWEGIQIATSWIINKIVSWVSAIAKRFCEGIKETIEAGKNLVEGLWKGISGSVTWIKNKIRGWVGDVTSFIKRLFGIASPSKVMRDVVGVNLVKGIVAGFDKEMPSFKKDVDSQLAWLTDYTADVDVGLSAKGLNIRDKMNVSLDDSFFNSTQKIILEVDGMTLTEIVNTYNNKIKLAYGG